jgi:hypothetical protein
MRWFAISLVPVVVLSLIVITGCGKGGGGVGGDSGGGGDGGGGGAWGPVLDASNVSSYGGWYAEYPDAAIDTEGNLHLVWSDSQPTGDIYYAKFDGNSWSNPQNISITGHAGTPLIVVDGNDTIHVIWKNSGYLYYKNCTAGTWMSLPVNIGEYGGSTGFGPDCTCPSLLVDSGNNLHLLWVGGDQDISYAKWQAGTWSSPTNISNASGYLADCQNMALDSKGYPHVVWHQVPLPYYLGDYQIYYAAFDGTAWSPPANISNSAEYCWCPKVAIDSTDTVHCVWQEDVSILGQWERGLYTSLKYPLPIGVNKCSKRFRLHLNSLLHQTVKQLAA